MSARAQLDGALVPVPTGRVVTPGHGQSYHAPRRHALRTAHEPDATRRRFDSSACQEPAASDCAVVNAVVSVRRSCDDGDVRPDVTQLPCAITRRHVGLVAGPLLCTAMLLLEPPDGMTPLAPGRRLRSAC
jgi:hypothetical protein